MKDKAGSGKEWVKEMYDGTAFLLVYRVLVVLPLEAHYCSTDPKNKSTKIEEKEKT